MKAKRLHPTHRMNASEARYSLHLMGEQADGRVVRHRFEVVTLKLADQCTLTMDFMVTMADGTVELHDVKAVHRGRTTPHVEDDAMAKVRVAAHQYPEFRFLLVAYTPKGWIQKDVSAGEKRWSPMKSFSE